MEQNLCQLTQCGNVALGKLAQLSFGRSRGSSDERLEERLRFEGKRCRIPLCPQGVAQSVQGGRPRRSSPPLGRHLTACADGSASVSGASGGPAWEAAFCRGPSAAGPSLYRPRRGLTSTSPHPSPLPPRSGAGWGEDARPRA
eukprot:scaffold3612_cov395-Prasinococcus_capsulatus_cf.AAC.6